MKETKDKLNKKEKEVATLKDSLHHLQSKYRDAYAKLMASKKEQAQTEEKCHHLECSLSEVTRVKIELFSYLSDATRYCIYNHTHFRLGCHTYLTIPHTHDLFVSNAIFVLLFNHTYCHVHSIIPLL